MSGEIPPWEAESSGDDPSVTVLINSSAAWMHDALSAWADDDFMKVAVLAPLAVEHLGKAVLWYENPALLVVEIRNGAIHVGTSAQSRHVLLDALAVCKALLDRLGKDPRSFFGVHTEAALSLISEKRSEAGHRVAAKLARARGQLRDLEERLGEDMFKEVTDRLEAQAAVDLPTSAFGLDLWATDARCPECTSQGRLFGHVDVDPDVDFDIEPMGGGRYDSSPYVAGWFVTLLPQAFACNVCGLQLKGPDELSEGGLPAARISVGAEDLGEDFDPAEYADSQYSAYE